MPVMISVERRRQYRPFYYGILFVLFVGILFQVFPFLWLISSSLKDSAEIYALPPRIIPTVWHFDTYPNMLDLVPFFDYVKNSLVLCIGTILINLAISTTAAYSLSILKPRFGRVILLFFLASMMVPFEATLIPMFVMMVDFPIGHHNFINTFWALWLPFSAWALVIYLTKIAFDRIPRDLVDAARIDGASDLRIYVQIVLPLSRPILAASSIIIFTAVYNQFIMPLAMLPSPEKWTATIGLYSMQFGGTTPWNQVMAGAVLTTVPPLLIYLLFQRYIMQGISLTGITG
jgi:multiple sugar transport system permease protein